jgi:hypothetical protein
VRRAAAGNFIFINNEKIVKTFSRKVLLIEFKSTTSAASREDENLSKVHRAFGRRRRRSSYCARLFFRAHKSDDDKRSTLKIATGQGK